MTKYYILPIFTSFFSFIENGKCQVESVTEITVHNKSPKQIYDFMFSLTQEKYLLWHPEHKEFKLLKSTPDTIGSVFYFNEVINGFKIDYKWKVVAIEKNKKILMKARKYSVRVLFEITFKEEGNDTKVRHYLKIGNSLTSWIVKKYFFTETVIKNLDRHVKEEFKNLEWLIL